MSANFKYLVAIVLPEPWIGRLKRIQLDYKSPEWNISLDPHITLLPPSRALRDEEEAVLVLEGVAKGFKPFEILIDGVGKFNNDSFSVFAKVRDIQELSRLNGEVAAAAPEFADIDTAQLNDRGFHPHITLSNRLGNLQRQNEAAAAIEKQFVPFSFVCDHFSLLKKYPGESQWTEIQKLTL